MTFWVAGAALVGTVATGMMGADAAESAADTQAQSSREATQLQREMFEKQIALQEPWRQAGGIGLNRLMYGMGLSPTGTFTPGAGGGTATPGQPAGSAVQTAEQIRARLLPQFTTAGAAGASPAQTPYQQWLADHGIGGFGDGFGGDPSYSPPPPQTAAPIVNEAGLNAAVQAELARQQAAQTAQTNTATTNAQRDPNYGNLLRQFGRSDFQVDPGYDFIKSEGENSLARAAAASGGLGSGRYLKDFARFNQGLASQEYGKSFDRFNINQTNQFNRLASLAGIGQTAANQTGAAAQNFGLQAGNNIIGAGNAMAAGRVGGANAWGSAIGQGMSMYQNNQLMNRAFPQNTGFGSGSMVGGGNYVGSDPYIGYNASIGLR